MNRPWDIEPAVEDVIEVRTGGVETGCIPVKLLAVLNKFALDKLSGNVRINFQCGKILGFNAEEIVKIKPG